jgi:aconitate decarboxylase
MPAAKAPATVKDTGKPARPATDPAGPTGRLATWVAKTTLDDVPASVRDRAKHLMLDGIVRCPGRCAAALVPHWRRGGNGAR